MILVIVIGKPNRPTVGFLFGFWMPNIVKLCAT